jgi:hypothetical protein
LARSDIKLVKTGSRCPHFFISIVMASWGSEPKLMKRTLMKEAPK